MNIRLIAFQGQRLSHTGALVELWLHVLVCAIDQRSNTSPALVSLRILLAQSVHQIKQGADLDLDEILDDLDQVQELIAISRSIIQALPSDPLAPVPAAFLSSIAPQGGIWSSDFDTFELQSTRLQGFGQLFIQLLLGTLPPQRHTYQAWRSRREDVLMRTEHLRTSAEAIWVRLRYLLSGEGIDLRHTCLAVLHNEDAAMLCGVIVTLEKRIYMFDFAFMDVPILGGWLSSWWDMTDEWQRFPYRTAVAIALECIAEQA